MQKKTIGIVTAYFPPLNNAGSIRVESLFNTWQQQDNINLKVFTSQKLGSARELEHGDNVEIWRSKVQMVSNKHNILFRMLSEMFCLLAVFFKLLKTKVDILFVSSPPFSYAIMTYLLARLKKTAYIIDIRDIYPDVLFYAGIMKPDSLPGRILSNFERKLYKHATIISTVTDGMLKHIQRISPQQDVRLFFNGINPAVFKRNDNCQKEDKFTLIFHGILGRFQDIEFLVKYACFLKENSISDIQIKIIGMGLKEEYIKTSVAEFQLEQQIQFLGFVENKRIPDFLNRAHIGISPRTKEKISITNFPVKIYEYMGCGLPVVVIPESDAGCIVEAEKVGFQTDAKSISEFHVLILKLKDNQQLYDNYAANAYTLSQQFHRDKIAIQYFQLIEQQLLKN